VEFVPSDDQIINLNPIAKQPMARESEKIETIVKPGKEFYRETYI